MWLSSFVIGSERISVTGLDFCEPMLDEAREKKKAKSSYSDLEFSFGDCMDLPLAENSVDAVTVSFGVRNFEDRQKGLKKSSVPAPRWTSLRPRVFSARSLVLPYLLFLPKFILPWVAAVATGDKSAYDYLAGTIENFPTKEALAEQLKLAGFETVDAKGLTFSIVAIHEATKGSADAFGLS